MRPLRIPPGPFTTSLGYPRYPAGRAIVLTEVAGLVGVCTTAIASALGWSFPSFGYLFENCGVEARHHWHPRLGFAVLREPPPKPDGCRVSPIKGLACRRGPPADTQGRGRHWCRCHPLCAALIPWYVGRESLRLRICPPRQSRPGSRPATGLLPAYRRCREELLPRMASTSARSMGPHCICIALVGLSPRTVANDPLSHSTRNHPRRRLLVDGKCEDVQRFALSQQRHFLHYLVHLNQWRVAGTRPLHSALEVPVEARP